MAALREAARAGAPARVGRSCSRHAGIAALRRTARAGKTWRRCLASTAAARLRPRRRRPCSARVAFEHEVHRMAASCQPASQGTKAMEASLTVSSKSAQDATMLNPELRHSVDRYLDQVEQGPANVDAYGNLAFKAAAQLGAYASVLRMAARAVRRGGLRPRRVAAGHRAGHSCLAGGVCIIKSLEKDNQ